MSKRFSNASTYPLDWPDSFPRTKRPESSRFNTTLAKALENVQDALRKFAADSGKKMTGIVISSNYSLTDQRPADSGVAVYFTWDGETTCIPVDRYSLVEDNLQAIYHCIEAERTKLRHGGINLVKAAFRGYAALPPAQEMDWREVLGLSGNDTVTLDDAKKARRDLMRQCHPDTGETGDNIKAAQINAAYEKAKEVLRES